MNDRARAIETLSALMLELSLRAPDLGLTLSAPDDDVTLIVNHETEVTVRAETRAAVLGYRITWPTRGGATSYRTLDLLVAIEIASTEAIIPAWKKP